ncbi:MAG: S26 family signal peptidase [Candidatus Omnitrophica bacterium]|nr:S26 family signal peptidase [Candidatus Omnitrophota bacterium]
MSNQAVIESSYVADEKKAISLSGNTLIELIRGCVENKRSFRFKVKGSSMTPFIKDEDIVTISPVISPSVRIGEAIAFLRPNCGKLVIHRVVKRDGNAYLVKGDGVPGTDGFIPRDRILGVVAKIERGGRKISFGAGHERVLIALLSRSGLLFPIFWCWRLASFPVRKISQWKNAS